MLFALGRTASLSYYYRPKLPFYSELRNASITIKEISKYAANRIYHLLTWLVRELGFVFYQCHRSLGGSGNIPKYIVV